MRGAYLKFFLDKRGLIERGLKIEGGLVELLWYHNVFCICGP